MTIEVKYATRGTSKKFPATEKNHRNPKYPVFAIRLGPLPLPAESFAFIGVAVLVADTGYELFAACENIRDLDELYSELGMAGETPDDVMHSVCDPQLPDAGEVWGGVVENVDQSWDELVEAV